MIQISSVDFFYYAISIGFLILVGFLCYAAYHVGSTLKSLKILIEELEENTREFNAIKNKVRMGVVAAIGSVVKLFLQRRRGGEKNGR